MTRLEEDLEGLLVGKEVTGLRVEEAWIDPTPAQGDELNVTLVVGGEPESWEATYVDADSLVGLACEEAGVLSFVNFSVYSSDEVHSARVHAL